MQEGEVYDLLQAALVASETERLLLKPSWKPMTPPKVVRDFQAGSRLNGIYATLQLISIDDRGAVWCDGYSKEEINGQKIAKQVMARTREWHFSLQCYAEYPTDYLIMMRDYLKSDAGRLKIHPCTIIDLGVIHRIPSFQEGVFEGRAYFDLWLLTAETSENLIEYISVGDVSVSNCATQAEYSAFNYEQP
jgi:hypothetical protein